jgi:ribonuclease HI
MQQSNVIMYCDGACLGNPGPGGYAALLMLSTKNNQEKVVAGYELETTNNRMELKAAIAGLQALKRPCHVTIYCDSQYVIKGMTEWMDGWLKAGFRNARNKSIANVDLWQELLTARNGHTISWRWVRGHAGDEYNERVDEIAKEQAGLALHKLRLGH